MSSLIEVEHHSADGEVTVRRMRMRDWEAFRPAVRLEPGEFYLVYGDLKTRWDGARRMTLKVSRTAPGYVVQFRDTGTDVIPVVVPAE